MQCAEEPGEAHLSPQAAFLSVWAVCSLDGRNSFCELHVGRRLFCEIHEKHLKEVVITWPGKEAL